MRTGFIIAARVAAAILAAVMVAAGLAAAAYGAAAGIAGVVSAPDALAALGAALRSSAAIYLGTGLALSYSPRVRASILWAFPYGLPVLTTRSERLRHRVARVLLHVAMVLAWPVLLPGAATGPRSRRMPALRTALAEALGSLLLFVRRWPIQRTWADILHRSRPTRSVRRGPDIVPLAQWKKPEGEG